MKIKLIFMALCILAQICSQAALVKNWEIEIVPTEVSFEIHFYNRILLAYEGKDGSVWINSWEVLSDSEDYQSNDNTVYVNKYYWVNQTGFINWNEDFIYGSNDVAEFAYYPKHLSNDEAVIEKITYASNELSRSHLFRASNYERIDTEIWRHDKNTEKVEVEPIPYGGRVLNPNLKNFGLSMKEMDGFVLGITSVETNMYHSFEDQKPSLSLENIYIGQANGRAIKLISLSFQPSQTSGELSISTTPTNDVTLKATGDPNTEYTMQSSEDTEVWTDLFPLQIPTGSQEFLVNPEARKKFFRMRSGVQQ